MAAAAHREETQANIDNIHMGNMGFGHGGDHEGVEFGRVRSEVRKIEGRHSGHRDGHSRGRSPTLKDCFGVHNSRKLPVIELVDTHVVSGRSWFDQTVGQPTRSGHCNVDKVDSVPDR